MAADDLENDSEEIVPIPIEGELDLHTFRPQNVKEAVSAYPAACLEKGIGNLRWTVHALLAQMPQLEITEKEALATGAGYWD